MSVAVVDQAADALRAGSRAFTRRNLYHAGRRLGVTGSYEQFVAGPLARRLRGGAIAGLLGEPRADHTRRLPREWDSYFPAAILLVDRRELVDLFAASGVLVQARLAVVCTDGTPATCVHWLRRGLRAGFRAPIGYLHDAATVLYPFALEPLRTLLEVADPRSPIEFVDLGLPPSGLAWSQLPFCPRVAERVIELEQPPPAAIIAYAARKLAKLLPRDPWLSPLDRGARRTRRSG